MKIKNFREKIQIMKYQNMYNAWNNFINDKKYKKYFQSPGDYWFQTLNEVINYINKKNKRPSNHDQDKEIKQLGNWIGIQKQNYKTKKQIMSNKEIYCKWTNFINDKKYKIYFQSSEDSWYKLFNQVVKYINTYNKRPSAKNKDTEIKQLGNWISHQLKNYKKKQR